MLKKLRTFGLSNYDKQMQFAMIWSGANIIRFHWEGLFIFLLCKVLPKSSQKHFETLWKHSWKGLIKFFAPECRKGIQNMRPNQKKQGWWCLSGDNKHNDNLWVGLFVAYTKWSPVHWSGALTTELLGSSWRARSRFMACDTHPAYSYDQQCRKHRVC